ncbi:hypothetical protein TRVL_09509 [Trypanosoma vivax]|nr:hypothetical protein TRVL_09509 [Trypanosoma vivax]
MKVIEYISTRQRRGLLVGHMAQHPPDVLVVVEEIIKISREDEAIGDGNALERRLHAKQCALYAWLRKHMVQKHPEKQLSSGGMEKQDALDSESGAAQKGHEKEFVCQSCNRVLMSKTWLTRHKYEVITNINSNVLNVAKRSVTVACPICSKENHYTWLLRHMLSKHPGHD